MHRHKTVAVSHFRGHILRRLHLKTDRTTATWLDCPISKAPSNGADKCVHTSQRNDDFNWWIIPWPNLWINESWDSLHLNDKTFFKEGMAPTSSETSNVNWTEQLTLHMVKGREGVFMGWGDRILRRMQPEYTADMATIPIKDSMCGI